MSDTLPISVPIRITRVKDELILTRDDTRAELGRADFGDPNVRERFKEIVPDMKERIAWRQQQEELRLANRTKWEWIKEDGPAALMMAGMILTFPIWLIVWAWFKFTEETPS